jgi:hypothetical protein
MEPLHAVIGVRFNRSKNLTYYVKRSDKMQNYPGVWSLLSIQYKPEELLDHLELWQAAPIFQRLSDERLGGVPIKVVRYLTSGTCSKNPINRRVTLHLYEIEFRQPVLNEAYYVEEAWLTPEEYVERAAGQTCGLCMRLWSDYAVRNGLAIKRFAPKPELDMTPERLMEKLADAFTEIETTDARVHEVHVGKAYYKMLPPLLLWGASVVLDPQLKKKVRLHYWRKGPVQKIERQPGEKAYHKSIVLR